ncbi:MAG: nucleotide sugar dehydrogenase, partial [Acidimicrobiales bacterium]|nr:nucleotide sugar dehydrogenase [Acidimicrobiales bacterium]
MTATGGVAIVGGCGHVGLPLGLAFADSGLDVVLYDINEAAIDTVRAGKMPFFETGADEVLERVLANGRLTLSSDPASVSNVQNVVVVVGTPVDEHLNPDPAAVVKAIEAMIDHLHDGQLLVLRSTVYPGVTALVERLLAKHGKAIEVAFCPERIAEGKAMEELYTLPQIISGRTPEAIDRAGDLFGNLTKQVIPLEVEEAELAKLFTNTWRYIKFAAANQLYMMANDFGVDFDRIREAMTKDYPRASDVPGPGLAAGPCLLKDTMQLAAFNNNNFMLGHAAMMVNEGLPMYMIDQIEKDHDLSTMTVGLLGMAFKGESDDIRSSLSYKLKRLLKIKADRVLCSDPYVTVDPDLAPLDQVLEQADIIVIGAPHKPYAHLAPTVPVFDIWNVISTGAR